MRQLFEESSLSVLAAPHNSHLFAITVQSHLTANFAQLAGSGSALLALWGSRLMRYKLTLLFLLDAFQNGSREWEEKEDHLFARQRAHSRWRHLRSWRTFTQSLTTPHQRLRRRKPARRDRIMDTQELHLTVAATPQRNKCFVCRKQRNC